MKLHLGASVSCLRSYCQPFRTEPGDILYAAGSHLFLRLIFNTVLLSSPVTVTLSFYPSWVVDLAPPLSSFSDHLSFTSISCFSLSSFLPHLPALFSPHIALIISTSHSLVFPSYQGLMADSDSRSTQWTNDTKTWGHYFTYSA